MKYIVFFLSSLIIYYIVTFLISFYLIASSVSKNDPIRLSKYVLSKDIKNNFFNDINKFGARLSESINKEINIKNDGIEFSGKISDNFLKKTLLKISTNISSDFSKPNILLYFYFNTNELDSYLKNMFIYLGKYNFKIYNINKNNEKELELLENKISEDESKNNLETPSEVNKLIENENNNIFITSIIKKIKATNYFFLINPLNFKMDLMHQDFRFIVILKFNGVFWKIKEIRIPYDKFLSKKDINLVF